MRRYLPSCLLFALLQTSTACSNYDVTVNDATVYRPQRPFNQFDVTDPALQACLEQVIADQVITEAAGLTHLSCSHAGISDLDGLRAFTAISHLKLSANNIRNLLELRQLKNLQVLQLDGNNIVDPIPLRALRRLEHLDLRDNKNLQCPPPDSFSRVEHVSLPAHCATSPDEMNSPAALESPYR